MMGTTTRKLRCSTEKASYEVSPLTFYTDLSSIERRQVSDLCTQIEETATERGVPHFEQVILEADAPLRLALLEQLLPLEIEGYRRTHGRTPTLHELGVLFPNLERLLPLAYQQLDQDVRLPDELSAYRLIRVVGSGSQATIAVGQHRRLQQLVAIKFSRDERAAKRLLQEAGFLSRLAGLNVPQVLDDGRTAEGVAYVVMEFLEGQNLLDLIKDQGRIEDPVRCARFTLQIAHTVAEMHQRGILHRDLSPRNIHVGDDGVLRIVDFGLAMDCQTGLSERTSVVEFHGTPAFMAPEQLAEDGHVNGKLSDVYSVGRLLLFVTHGFEAVAPSRPDVSASPGRTVIRWPDRSLAQIYAAATDPDPSQRYPGARELSEDLGQYLSRIERQHRRRHVWRRSLLLATLLLSGSWIWLNWVQPHFAGSAGDLQPTLGAAVTLAPPAPPPIETHTVSLANDVDLEFVSIPAGTFAMGAAEGDEFADADEFPQHPVTLTQPFAMSRTEVTVAQFAAFVTATGYRTDAEQLDAGLNPLARVAAGLMGQSVNSWREPGYPQQADHPVVNVSWNDAVAFCDWLSRTQHRPYRLPTEAEWEYVCRAGTHQARQNEHRPSARTSTLSAAEKAPQAFTRPVRETSENGFGLFGLEENVAEWCLDWYAADAYRKSPVEDPTGPESGQYRVRRGGAYNLPAEDCRVTDRNGSRPNGMHPFIGFRVVEAPPLSLVGQWEILQGKSVFWSSPVTLSQDGTSSLGFGHWRYLWNGFDRFELTDINGRKPSAFGGRDSDFTWDARLIGDRLELFQNGIMKVALQRLPPGE